MDSIFRWFIASIPETAQNMGSLRHAVVIIYAICMNDNETLSNKHLVGHSYVIKKGLKDKEMLETDTYSVHIPVQNKSE